MSNGKPSWRSDKRTAAQRGYNARWRKARRTYLQQHPLCVMCDREGRVEAATVVDHIKPHCNDQKLFWDTNNWQSLCKVHHDSTKQRIERRGHEIGCDENGIPLDQHHHWR